MVRNLRASGYKNLTPGRIIELQALGVRNFAAGRTGPPSDWPPTPEPSEPHEPAEPHDPDPER
jgi:hypothetical protein